LAWCVTDKNQRELTSELPGELLKDPRIWKAGRLFRSRQVLSTGFADLDQALSGGWPVGVLTEFLIDCYGIGEFRLLLPALKALGECSSGESTSGGARKKILLVAPPYVPYAPAFEWQGVNVSRLLVAHCRAQTDALWAMEQALRSGTCAAVLAWVEDIDERSLRRLQLALEEGSVEAGATDEGVGNRHCWAAIFRPSRFESRNSPAALRIRLRSGGSSGISMNIFKNRGGRPRELEVQVPDIEVKRTPHKK
jgi:protein ImuA